LRYSPDDSLLALWAAKDIDSAPSGRDGASMGITMYLLNLIYWGVWVLVWLVSTGFWGWAFLLWWVDSEAGPGREPALALSVTGSMSVMAWFR
jgi:hypothetical protein